MTGCNPDGSCASGGVGGGSGGFGGGGGGGGFISSGVGKACGSDPDCSTFAPGALGDAGSCRRATAMGTFDYPGGYCTRACGQSAACPLDSECVTSVLLGESASICWKRCTPAKGFAPSPDCRFPGYACYAPGFCWIDPPADAGTIGKPCASSSECANPPTNGFCHRALFSDGGSTGWTGGYCSAICTTTGDAYCSADGVCVVINADAGQERAECRARCGEPGAGDGDGDGGCRAGYVCIGGDAGSSRCERSCLNAGAGCPATASCDALGYCR